MKADPARPCHVAAGPRPGHPAGVETFRTDLSRTTSPARLIALRAVACLGGALLLAAPVLLLGGARAVPACVVLAAHVALSIAAVSRLELRAVRTGGLVRCAVLAGAAAAACMTLGFGQAWFAAVAWSSGHDAAYAGLQDALARPDAVAGTLIVLLPALTAFWGLPCGLITYERLHGRSPDAMPLWLGLLGWIPGLLVLFGLAGCYAVAADWDERLGGAAPAPAGDGSETIRRPRTLSRRAATKPERLV